MSATPEPIVSVYHRFGAAEHPDGRVNVVVVLTDRATGYEATAELTDAEADRLSLELADGRGELRAGRLISTSDPVRLALGLQRAARFARQLRSAR